MFGKGNNFLYEIVMKKEIKKFEWLKKMKIIYKIKLKL